MANQPTPLSLCVYIGKRQGVISDFYVALSIYNIPFGPSQTDRRTDRIDFKRQQPTNQPFTSFPKQLFSQMLLRPCCKKVLNRTHQQLLQQLSFPALNGYYSILLYLYLIYRYSLIPTLYSYFLSSSPQTVFYLVLVVYRKTASKFLPLLFCSSKAIKTLALLYFLF